MTIDISSQKFLQALVVLNVRATHPGQKMLKCITGEAALQVRENGINIIDQVMELTEKCEEYFNDDLEDDLTSEERQEKAEVANTIGKANQSS